ncbi:MAG: DUF975 family protein [Clostridia bacterium]|nr:DUF975 family protein [Clostridia bacterium]
MNITNSELRRRARQTLGGRIFGSKWLMGLAICFVMSAILGTASTITSGIASLILTGPITFGLLKTFLVSSREQSEITFDNAFDGFKNFGQTLLLGLMQSIFVALWSLLFVIPGIVKAYSYSMAYYIMVDNPDYDWNRCITESRNMMRGHKWQLFCLDFSFIGWIFVGALCFGIGTLWVTPYQYAARTEFYKELKGDVNFSADTADTGNYF